MNCKECGATVERSDRFCPACGTPNLSAKFHPRFAPALRRFEAEILFDEAPDGSPACPRCGRVIRAGIRFCEGCGMDLAGAWMRERRQRAIAEWNGRDPAARPFRQVAGRGLRTALALAALIAVAVAAGELAGPSAVEAGTVAGVSSGLAVAEAGAGVLALLVFVLLVRWMARATANLPALAVLDGRYGPGWALAGWLIPGLNLVRPKQMVDDLWRASAEDVALCSPEWRRRPRPLLARLWWSTLGLGVVLVGAAAMVSSGATSVDAGTADVLAGAAALALACSALCLRRLVRRIGERQAHRAAMVADPAAWVVPAAEPEPDGEIPTRLEALAPLVGTRRTSALRLQPSARRPVYGKY